MVTPSTRHPPAASPPPGGPHAQAQAQRQAFRRRKARAQDQREARRQEEVARVEALPVHHPHAAGIDIAYPQVYNQKPGLGFPIARVGAVISLACGAVVNLGFCRYAGKGQGEVSLLRRLWDVLHPGDVVLADRLTANLFMVSEPLLGWRAVHVTERRTAKDFAEVLRWLVEDVHPDAEKVVLVLDNLNTHQVASLYEAFPPEQARRIAARLEIHHTPKHGSWLNVAEIELSVLARQCLDRRIGDAGELRREVGAWEDDRNERAVEVRWRFTTADARIKLRRLYPVLQ